MISIISVLTKKQIWCIWPIWQALEIHAMNIQMQAPANPDTIIFDLDPSEGLSFETIKTTAIDLYNMLEDKGYHPHIKTSGSKGLHIYVPIFPYIRE
jgi:bifunctional non-homologous end joining protein LigD